MTTELKYIQMVKNGSKEAFECLFRKYYHALVIFSNKFIGNKDTAEDVVQTFFCSLWDNRDKITINSSVKNYLFTSVKNSTLNYIKYDNKFLRNENTGQLIEELYSTEPIDIEELEIEVINAIAKLSEKEREVFLLHYKDGYSYQEIAGKLGVSINTIKTHVLRTKKIFKNKSLLILLDMKLFC